ncbi:glycoside hydrolase family 66 protein [Bacteroides thetaiotaomicron]|nr:glycoside hydrolase family 66 protein [Bacteroides thetaiotaomicron]
MADFDGDKTEEKTLEEMAYLNRHHINWVQFQDWHNKHHWPLGGTRTQLDEEYLDIANRPVHTRLCEELYQGTTTFWNEVHVL